MAPATAAATRAPSPSWGLGAVTTARSLLMAWARVTNALTSSPFPPGTTQIRSFRAWDAAVTLSRRACCTVSVSLSHTTMLTSSSPSRAAKAAA